MISILIPCYNERENIAEIVKKFITICVDKKIKLEKIILVDDGSNDKTWEIIKKLHIRYKKKILGLKLSKNFGHQNAILAGLKECKSSYLLITDADMQDPPELIYKMLRLMIKEKANCVYGKRLSRDDNIFKKILSYMFYILISRLTKNNVKKNVGDFKIIDKKILNELKKYKETDPFLRGIITSIGFKQIPYEYHRKSRKKGNSGWSFNKLISFSMDGIFGFSNFPLKIGSLITICSLALFLYLATDSLIAYEKNILVPGWKSIFLAIVFVSFVNFFMLTLLSEYIGRIYMETKSRPRYIVEKKLS